MSFRGMLMGCLLSVSALSAHAADKSVTLDTGEVFTINWGADWVVGTNPPDAPQGTITINGPNATIWRIAVGPLPPHPSLAADPGNLRMYMRIWARGMENAGIAVDPEQ